MFDTQPYHGIQHAFASRLSLEALSQIYVSHFIHPILLLAPRSLLLAPRFLLLSPQFLLAFSPCTLSLGTEPSRCGNPSKVNLLEGGGAVATVRTGSMVPRGMPAYAKGLSSGSSSGYV